MYFAQKRDKVPLVGRKITMWILQIVLKIVNMINVIMVNMTGTGHQSFTIQKIKTIWACKS